MDENAWLAERFEANRPHLRGVAYRMLGSVTEADDAVQETWIRLSRTDTSDVENLRAWLTTVVGRVCLNMLRSRRTRGEASLDTHVPDPIVGPEQGGDPEQEALLGDAVGLALFVVLDSLTPAERVSFVLHDVFAVPFDDIAPIVDRTPTATRQLASRARRRVQGAPVPDVDLVGPVGRRRRLPRGRPRGRLRAVARGPRPGRRAARRRRRGPSEPDGDRPWRAGRRGPGADVPPVRGDGHARARQRRPGGVAWLPDGRPAAVLAMTVRGAGSSRSRCSRTRIG